MSLLQCVSLCIGNLPKSILLNWIPILSSSTTWVTKELRSKTKDPKTHLLSVIWCRGSRCRDQAYKMAKSRQRQDKHVRVKQHYESKTLSEEGCAWHRVRRRGNETEHVQYRGKVTRTRCNIRLGQVIIPTGSTRGEERSDSETRDVSVESITGNIE